MTQSSPNQPWGPLCQQHNEDIDDLRLQAGLLQKGQDKIIAVLENGLIERLEKIEGLISDIKSGGHYIWLTGRGAVMFVVGTIFALGSLDAVLQALDWLGIIR